MTPDSANARIMALKLWPSYFLGAPCCNGVFTEFGFCGSICCWFGGDGGNEYHGYICCMIVNIVNMFRPFSNSSDIVNMTSRFNVVVCFVFVL